MVSATPKTVKQFLAKEQLPETSQGKQCSLLIGLVSYVERFEYTLHIDNSVAPVIYRIEHNNML
jgi:hypothetical protein